MSRIKTDGETRVFTDDFTHMCGNEFETDGKIREQPSPDQVLLSCFDASINELRYIERLKKVFTTLEIFTNRKLYLVPAEGNALAIKSGSAPEQSVRNVLHDICKVLPAISGHTLFFRIRHDEFAVD